MKQLLKLCKRLEMSYKNGLLLLDLARKNNFKLFFFFSKNFTVYSTQSCICSQFCIVSLSIVAYQFFELMASSWKHCKWEWNSDTWSWQQVSPRQPWTNTWRGETRPGSVRLEKKPISHSSSSIRRRGAWRDPKHKYEDHEVLRCPWPGGKWTFSPTPDEGCWEQVVAEACDIGLAQLSAVFF
jgi:hypothetical protein